MDDLAYRMNQCRMDRMGETLPILPLPEEIRGIVMGHMSRMITTVDELVCYNRSFRNPMNYYIYEQIYCSISTAVVTDRLDEIVIVLARTVTAANEYMAQFVNFYETDCPMCVPRWMPLYEGDEADIELERRTRLVGKRIKWWGWGDRLSPITPSSNRT